jgi:circadian clock protein KaiB
MERENRGAEDTLVLRLYVAGDGPNSREAVGNLNAICSRWLEPRAYEVEIIDVLEEPLRALDDGVLVTPTLTVNGAAPVSIVGTLSDHGAVVRALGLEPRESEGPQSRVD